MILQIETATTSCSVALTHDGQILAVKELDQRNIHAEVITLFIEAVFAAAGKKYNNVDAVAVSCGPGSYTGLRIGVSTAKGFCYALNKPLIAVETLKAMADGIIASPAIDMAVDTLLCPMIDARRMEVFTSVFNRQGSRVMPTEAMIIEQDSFTDLLKEHQIIFFGDGAAKCRETLTHPNAHFYDGFTNSAAYLTAAASAKYNAGQFEDLAYFEPYYLKDFIAGKKQA